MIYHLTTSLRFLHISFGLCIPVFVAMLFTGCSTYQNITGYFNTYYNAKRTFDQAVEEVKKANPKDRDTNYFAIRNVPGTAQTKFDQVVEKASKLIQFYPKSKWVEEGLLLIGKSDVYLGDYDAAIRKFTELLENFPNSDRSFEAKLWHVRAEYYQKNSNEALKILKEFVPEAEAEGQDDLVLEGLLLEGQMYIERTEYQPAVASYARAVRVSGDGYLRALAQYQLGLCYERIGDNLKAAEAYGKVTDFDPDDALEFNSRLKHGMMLSATEQFDKAFEIFDALNEEPLKNEQRGLVLLEIANTYSAMEDTGEAFALYNLIDTTYRRTDAAAKSYYQQGLIHEEILLDFTRARDYYTKAKGEFQNSEITPFAQRKIENFSQYFTLRSNLKKYDSLLTRALNPDTGQVKKDSLKVKTDSSSSKSDGQANVDTTKPASDSLIAEKHPAVADSVQDIFQPPDIFQEELKPPPEEDVRDDITLAQRRRAERDTSDRRAEKLPDSLARPLTEKQDTLKSKAKAGSGAQSQKLSPDSLRALIAQTEFELGGLFYLEFDLPDSALYWYQKIIEEHPSSPIVPRVLYAVAEVYRAYQDSVAVDSVYNLLLDRYAESEYAVQVKKLRGLEVTSLHKDSAEALYEQAEHFLNAGEPHKALTSLQQILLRYPSHPLVSKTLYAVGWIYENVVVNNDSADVWFKRLIKEYPTTVYAATAQPKVAVKEKPESVSQYVKIKEIQPIPKPQAQARQRPGAQSTQQQAQRPTQESQRNIRQNRGLDEDMDDEEPEEPEDEPEDDDE
ncbi:MAG: tetratricopeptide repeat protein [Ignavibacteriae bacterium]|nr:tetratricopeptide repeat protein [Ignavibacteriota bacterium]